MANEQIRVAAVDDHELYLNGLRRALKLAPDIQLVAEGSNADQALLIAAEHKPDVLILDIGIPGNGIEAAKRIAASNTGVKILMLTGSDDDDHVSAALASGAKGYLLKGLETEELFEAIRVIASGEPYIMQTVATRLLMQRIHAELAPQGDNTGDALLGVRERQVLESAAQGLTNKEIAAKLGLTVRTVKNYMSRILVKLQASNRYAAVATFRRQ